jgi:putative hydrolase of HD superfamily
MENKYKKWEDLLSFMHQINKLKKTWRFGGEEDIFRESSAEHSWRLAMFVLMCAEMLDMKLDKIYTIKLALIHDLAELITGDVNIVKHLKGEQSLDEKFQQENQAWQQFKEYLDENVHKELYDLWLDFEEKKSLEAKVVSALDRMEGSLHILQVGCHRHSCPEMLANSNDKYVKDLPQLHDLLTVIKKMHKEEFEKNNIPWQDEYEQFLY